MTDGNTNWSELREFKAVDLTASFVLSWHCERDSLLLDIDLCLTPEHVFYEAPRPSEMACFRPGVLEFSSCTELLTGDGAAVDDAIRELAGRLGHGRISGFQRIDDGVYCLDGQFGVVRISSERPILRLKSLLS